MPTASTVAATHTPLWNTPEHHGPAVSVVTWFLIIAVVLSVAARTITRYALIKRLRWDDCLILLATVLAIGQTIAVSIEAAAGLGSRGKPLSGVELIRFQKSNYASNLLYVTILGLVKVSACFHIYSLTPVRTQRLISIIAGGFCALWTLVSLVVAVFECKLPYAWEIIGGKCINLLAFWTYFVVLNIITDLALIGLPIPIVVKLQVSTEKKAVILSCYAIRLSAVAAAIVQLYYLRTRASGSANFIYDLWVPVLCTQVVIALSIISACFPFLKSLIDALETGMVRIETRPANGAQHFGSSGGKQYSGSGGGYYRAQGSQFRQQPSTAGSPSSVPRNHSASPMNHSDVLRMDSLNLHGVGNVHQGNQLHGVATMASKADNDVDSQSSQAHILKKVEWSLTEENTGLPRA